VIALSARCRGIHETFIASEHVDDILFDMMDEIVPIHFARWPKLRTLGENEKHNGISEKLAFLKFFVNVREQREVEDENTL
jgi:hypothetical protein